jgi:hypothetical protein
MVILVEYCQYGLTSPPAPLRGGEGGSKVAQGEIFELMGLLPPSPPWRGAGGEEKHGEAEAVLGGEGRSYFLTAFKN